jgi:hypothetical protein
LPFYNQHCRATHQIAHTLRPLEDDCGATHDVLPLKRAGATDVLKQQPETRPKIADCR